MSKHIERIHQRRAQLVQQAATQRSDLAWQIEPWKKRLSYVDQAVALTRRVRARPILIALALAGLAFMVRRRVSSVVGVGKAAWRVYRLFIKT